MAQYDLAKPKKLRSGRGFGTWQLGVCALLPAWCPLIWYTMSFSNTTYLAAYCKKKA